MSHFVLTNSFVYIIIISTMLYISEEKIHLSISATIIITCIIINYQSSSTAVVCSDPLSLHQSVLSPSDLQYSLACFTSVECICSMSPAHFGLHGMGGIGDHNSSGLTDTPRATAFLKDSCLILCETTEIHIVQSK